MNTSEQKIYAADWLSDSLSLNVILLQVCQPSEKDTLNAG